MLAHAAGDVSYKESMAYPMESYLRDDGHWTTYDPMNVIESLDGDLFFDMKEVYAFQEGQCDGAEWIFLGKTNLDYYVFMEAGCDYTGFDCKEGGTVAITNNWETLWNHYMDENSRDFVRRQNNLPSFTVAMPH